MTNPPPYPPANPSNPPAYPAQAPVAPAQAPGYPAQAYPAQAPVVYPAQPQAGAWPPPPYGTPSRTNTMAILAIIFGFVFSVLGIVFGHIALSQIKRTGESGRGLALTGLIVGYVSVGLGVVFLILYVLYFAFIIAMFGAVASDPSYYS